MNTNAKNYLALQVAHGWIFNERLQGWLSKDGTYYPNNSEDGFGILHTRNAHRIEPLLLKGLSKDFDYPATSTVDLYMLMYEARYLHVVYDGSCLVCEGLRATRAQRDFVDAMNTLESGSCRAVEYLHYVRDDCLSCNRTLRGAELYAGELLTREEDERVRLAVEYAQTQTVTQTVTQTQTQTQTVTQTKRFISIRVNSRVYNSALELHPSQNQLNIDSAMRFFRK